MSLKTFYEPIRSFLHGNKLPEDALLKIGCPGLITIYGFIKKQTKLECYIELAALDAGDISRARGMGYHFEPEALNFMLGLITASIGKSENFKMEKNHILYHSIILPQDYPLVLGAKNKYAAIEKLFKN